MTYETAIENAAAAVTAEKLDAAHAWMRIAESLLAARVSAAE